MIGGYGYVTALSQVVDQWVAAQVEQAVTQAQDEARVEADELRDQIAATTAEATITAQQETITTLRADLAACQEPGGTDPPPDPPVLLGAYLGMPSEAPTEKHEALFGADAEIVSRYMQAAGRNGRYIRVEYDVECARRGAKVLLYTWTTTAGAGPGPFTHRQIADGEADGWLTDVANDLATLRSALDLEGMQDVRLVVAFDHEVEVKDNKGLLALVVGDYAAASARFFSFVQEQVPSVETAHWYGYARRTVIDLIGQALASSGFRPDVVVLDPYVWLRSGPDVDLEDMASPQLEWLRSRSWFDGQSIFFGEYAKDARHGDESVAQFVTDLRPRLAALGVTAAVWFFRDKSGPDNSGPDIDGVMIAAENPLTVAAYAANFDHS